MIDSLSELCELVQRSSGIVLGPSRLPALRAAIDRVCAGATPSELLELAADPRSGTTTLDRLVDEMTVNETFFMRHRAELDGIPWTTLLDDARRRGQSAVRVWSAGCSTGEEAYSLAILALQALSGEPMAVSVLATDISRSCVARAAAGLYGVRALRHVEPGVRRRYFESAAGATTEVGAEVRALVRVARHNLVRDCVPPAGEAPFDVIVCRNVLIYFGAETAARTASRLQGALTGPGVVVLGASDRLLLARPGLRARERPTAAPCHAPPRRHVPSSIASARDGPGKPLLPVHSLAHDPTPLATVLAEADAGRLVAALGAVQPILAADPLNTVALFIEGLVLHAQGNPAAAVGPLRRALYLDPAFVRAAFELGRAQDALGDRPAAQRAYRQALEGLSDGAPGERVLGDTDEGLADACRVLLAASAGAGER